MKGSDKVLIGIVVGIVVLIGVAFALAFLQPQPAYQSEESPEGVAHNYLFALQQGDYERAYGYLSPSIAGYPQTVEKFRLDVQEYSWVFRTLADGSTSLSVESARFIGESRAVVSVRETRFYRGDPFGSGEDVSFFDLELRFEEGGWRLIDSDKYWPWCWNLDDGCR